MKSIAHGQNPHGDRISSCERLGIPAGHDVGGWSRPEVEEMQLSTFGPEMVPSAWTNVLKTRGSGTVAMASRQEKEGQTTNWYEINNIDREKGRIS